MMQDMYSGNKRSGGDFNDPSKRQKPDSQAQPSKVLHVRGLPAYTTESELVSVVAPFGLVQKVLLIPDKNQAFIQMSTVQAADNILNNLEFTQPQIRSKPIYFQYSARQELESKSAGGGVGEVGDASSTLLISVLNVSVPVTLDNICQICKPYGEVMKIITFPKGTDFQALVQMATVEQAVNAKMFLDGKDLFQGCCHLRVNFSKRTNLVIKENSHKSRDFTQGAGMGMMGNPMGGAMQGGMGGMGMMGGQNAMASGVNNQGGAVVLVSKMNPETTCDALFMLFGVYGDVIRVKILYNKRDTAMIQFAQPSQAAYAVQNLSGCPFVGYTISVNSSKHKEIQMPKEQDELSLSLTKDYSGHPDHRYKKKVHLNAKNMNPPSQVLHVSNLHDNCTEQELRDVFGAQQPTMPAPVVEFFKNSRKMAYVCMANVECAVTALVGLHSCPLNGYALRVSFSHKDPAQVANSDQ